MGEPKDVARDHCELHARLWRTLRIKTIGIAAGPAGLPFSPGSEFLTCFFLSRFEVSPEIWKIFTTQVRNSLLRGTEAVDW